MKWISTTRKEYWKERTIGPENVLDENKMTLTGEKGQTIKGFGGCFNEVGAIALEKTDDKGREQIFKQLFSTEEDSCHFNFCRVPIGASDYGAEWYSLDEYDEDYEMEHFSIDRDRKYLIPYIHKAMEKQPDLTLFASPWSPPTWMKAPKAYNFGQIRMEDRVLKAYALYFKKFVEAYKQEGINVEQVYVQNEVFADMKYPSCKWTAQQLKIFIRDYIGPLFKQSNMNTQIWLGTLNGPEDSLYIPGAGIQVDNYNRYVDAILFDKDTRKYISGIGYQWSGRNVISRTYESWPEIPLVQTENECGTGENSWEYAEYVFGLMHRYFHEGVIAYTYWNMVLETGGSSTWGWRQNSMVTIDPKNGQVIFNPEFYAMKHFSAFVQPGAVLLKTRGHWNSVTTVFQNPDHSCVVVVQNALDQEMPFTFSGCDKSFTAVLPPNSMNTFVF